MTRIKTFSVNLDDEEELAKTIQVLKTHLGNARVNAGALSKNQRNQKVFEHCVDIWNTNISDVYSGLKLDPTPRYYVYAHLDTSHNIIASKEGKTTFAATLGMSHFPFYIGKGTGDRAHKLNRNETHRKTCERIKRLGKEPKVHLVKENLTELEALCFESKLIDILDFFPTVVDYQISTRVSMHHNDEHYMPLISVKLERCINKC